MRIVIVGAGISGILMGMQLKEQGFEDFVILEKAQAVGGTWRDNLYPGITCDVPSLLYAYAAEPNLDWSSLYPRGGEIKRYVEHVAAKRGLVQRVRFGQEVTRAQWTGRRWNVSTRSGTTIHADAVIAATGTLHHPIRPTIAGLERFTGPVVHSAQWRDDVTWAGRKIGVVGTGSSAAQLIPELASVARKLLVFQRTPSWVLDVRNPCLPTWLRRIIRRMPAFLRVAHYLGSELLIRSYGGSFVGRSRFTRWLIERRSRRSLLKIHNPDLRRKLTPEYVPGCKRLIFSDRYYPALQRPNVSLITDPIAEITANGILTRDQYLHRLDAIILATGFDGHAYLRPIQVTGVDGITLDSIWQDRPIAYRSVCVPQLPNFFLVVGPNSPVANLSVVKVAEWQCAFILRCLKVARHGRIALSPSRAAIARELEAIDSAAPRTVWGSGCRSWYLDHKGRPNLYTLPPWQYRAALSSGPDLQDFDTFRLLEQD